jgi:hypothetical protein
VVLTATALRDVGSSSAPVHCTVPTGSAIRHCSSHHGLPDPVLPRRGQRRRFAWPGEPVRIATGALVFITTAVSGLDYVLIYSRRAAAVSRGRAAGAH